MINGGKDSTLLACHGMLNLISWKFMILFRAINFRKLKRIHSNLDGVMIFKHLTNLNGEKDTIGVLQNKQYLWNNRLMWRMGH